jgi:hypothetical protein
MSSSDLIRWGALAAMLAGVVWIAYALLGLAGANQEESGPLDILIIIAWLLQVAGLIGFHTLQKENYGRIGRAGFYTFVVGAPAQSLGLLLVLAGSLTLGEILINVGGFGILVGLVLYGAATLQARVLPRWCGIALIVSLPLTILLQDYGGLVFGLVWLALGYVLWSRRAQAAAEQSARVS